jgi:hypothetical protein
MMQKPSWYVDWNASWRRRVGKLVQEREDADEPEELFTRQQQEYQTNINVWWGKCPDYVRDPYHTCKHLIRFYGESQHANDAHPVDIYRQPYWGEVWRQHLPPFLYIEGLHQDHQHMAKVLWDSEGIPAEDEDEPAPPVANATPIPPSNLNIIPPAPEDSDEDDDEESELSDGGEAEAPMSMAEEVAHSERVMRGKERKEGLLMMIARMDKLRPILEDLAKYDDGHPHLLETPYPKIENFVHFERYQHRRQSLNNARVFPTTFGGHRRGNVFVAIE